MAKLINMRKAYGAALVRLGQTHPDVVVLSADVSNSDHSYMFEEAYPERFFNVGIAEQSLVDVSVGLAYSGKVPFANTFAFLFETRALEMVRTHLCYGEANVKLMGAYAGLSDSFDGPTHHSITDVAILRALPGMTIVVPADGAAIDALLPQVADWPGPVYFRLSRNDVPVLFDASYTPVIGKAWPVRSGSDLTIFANGILLSRSLEAAQALEGEGISARVVEIHTVKPLDVEAVVAAARETGAAVTAEEHTIVGGLGGAVAEALAGCCPTPVEYVGLQDTFAETGPDTESLMDAMGLSVQDLVAATKRALARKG